MPVRSALFFLTVALSAGSVPAAATAEPLPTVVQQALQAANLPADALAAIALPLATASGERRTWTYQADRVMQPGSTMKLLTSIVALDQLGPNARGFTELRSAAPVQSGVLQGDLVLKGGADPELGVPQFWALLQELRHLGIRRIAGDLVIDRHHYRPARPDLGLPPFDDAPEFPYNVIPDALQLAGNLLPLALQSDAQTLQASTVPALPGLEFRATAMALSDTACSGWDATWVRPVVRREGGEGARTVIELQGSFPRNCSQRAQLQLIDRLELAERLFRTLWQEMGGRWDGRTREASVDEARATSTVLARRQSRPWGEVLRVVNKASDNPLTRMLYLNLGVPEMAAQPQASTAELSEQAVRRWFATNRIPDEGLVLDNGSGLSRSERITPRQLAQMLAVAYRSRYAADLIMSLPAVGVDGTMARRIRNSPATGWARLKTGTLRNVVALAGYVNGPDGEPWAVAMIINHAGAARGRPVLDALVDHMARHGPVAWLPQAQPLGGPSRGGVGPGAEGP